MVPAAQVRRASVLAGCWRSDVSKGDRASNESEGRHGPEAAGDGSGEADSVRGLGRLQPISDRHHSIRAFVVERAGFPMRGHYGIS